MVASCDVEAHTLQTQAAFSIQCCFHYRITATFSTFWLNLSDCHQRLPAVVQIVRHIIHCEVDFGRQNLLLPAVKIAALLITM